MLAAYTFARRRYLIIQRLMAKSKKFYRRIFAPSESVAIWQRI